jgi:hypothetical protein
MADKPDKRELDAVLSRLEEDWRELARLVGGPAPGPVLEAEAFCLQDAAGHPRGEWRLTPEDGAALVMNDAQGRSRVLLGLNDRGGAYLTLRDEFGAIIFQVPDGHPAPGEKAAASPDPALTARLEQVAGDLAALRELVQSREQAPAAAVAASAPVLQPDRLARLLGAGALAVALIALTGLGLALNRAPRPGGPVAAPAFVLQGPQGGTLARLDAPEGRARLEFLDQGRVRAFLGLDAGGAPGLTFYDGEQQPRAELSLGLQGEPTLGLRDEAGQLRAALGNLGPHNLGPAAALTRPTASLSFFDQQGRPLWLIPRRARPE